MKNIQCTNKEAEEERRISQLKRIERLYKAAHIAIPPFNAIIHIAA